MNTDLEKEFVPYTESLELKELGFDEPCFGSWETNYTEVPTYTPSISQFYKNSNHPIGKVSAPTFSQSFRFFREKYGLIHGIQMSGIKSVSYDIRKLTEHNYKIIEFSFCSLDGANTYEKAELACLKKLIEIVKRK